MVLGIVFTGLAHACFTASLQRVRVAVVAVVAALEPVYGIAAAWVFLGEAPTSRMLVGGVLIIGASLLSLLPDAAHQPESAATGARPVP